MNSITIYTNTGAVRTVVKDLELHDEWMAECFVTTTVKSAEPVEFGIGDWLDYRGEKYVLDADTTAQKKARRGSYGDGFVYDNVKFVSEAQSKLVRCDFTDLVLQDNEMHYTALPTFPVYCETVDDLLDRILACLEELYPGEFVIIGRNTYRNRQRALLTGNTHYDSEYRQWIDPTGSENTDAYGKTGVSLTFDNITCWEALIKVHEEFDLNFIVRGYTVIVGTAGVYTSNTFKYGKGNGLYEIERVVDSSQQVITRLKAYGSEENLPIRYYATLNAQLYANVTAIAEGSAESLYIDLRTDLPFGTSMFTESADFTDIGGDVHSNNGYVVTLRCGDASVKGKATKNAYGNTTDLYVEYKAVGDEDPGDEEDGAKVLAFIQSVQTGSKIYFTAGVKQSAWPKGFIDQSSSDALPDNMAVNRLMLPGFPTQSLHDWVQSHASDERIAAIIEEGFTFSTDPHRPYIDSPNVSVYGIRPGNMNFDGTDDTEDIKPTLKGMTWQGVAVDEIAYADVMTDNGVVGDDALPQEKRLFIRIPYAGFDMGKLWTSETAVEMLDGMCGGRSFKVLAKPHMKERDNVWEFSIERDLDDTLHIYFPYKDFQLQAGDHFVLTGIELPGSYVEAASERLFFAAVDALRENHDTRYTYQPKIDELFMQRQHDAAVAAVVQQQTGPGSGTSSSSSSSDEGADEEIAGSLHDTLKAGDVFRFEDTDLGIDAAIIIDVLTIKENGNNGIPTYEVTLRDEKQVGPIKKLQNKVDSLTSGGNGYGVGGGMTPAQVRSLLEGEGADWFLSKRYADTAQGLITFLEGLKVGGGDVYGIDGTGVGRLLELITREVRGESYTGTDLLGDEGFRVWTDEYGKGHIITDYLTTRIRQIVAELEVKRITFTSGNVYLSAANARFTKVEPITEGGRRTYAEILIAGGEVLTGSDEVLTGDSGQPIAPADTYAYRCYWPATDGERRTSNDWQVGDMAWCKTENLTAPGSFIYPQNRQYRRLVVAVGTEIVDGENCHYIDLSAVLNPVIEGTARTGYDANLSGGNDAPMAGDEVAQVGSQTDTERRGVIALNPVSDNPNIAIYAGVDDYDLPSHRVALLSPAEVNICASYFKLSTAVGTGQTTTPLLKPTVDMWWQNGQNLSVTNSIYVDADAESKIASLSQVQGLPVKIQVKLGNVVIPCSEWTSGTVDGVTIANSSSGITVMGTGVYVRRAYKNKDSATVEWQYTPIPQLGGQPVNPVITSRKIVVAIAFTHDNQAYTVEQEIQMTVQVKGATGAAGQDGTSLNVRGEALLHIESTSDPAPRGEDGTYLIDHDGNGNAGAYIVVVDDGDTYTLVTAGYCYKTTDQYHWDASQENHLWQAQSDGWYDIGPINASDAYSVLPDPSAISMEQNPTDNSWPQPKIGIKAMLGKNTRPYEITAVSSTELQVVRTDSNQKVQITDVNQNNGEYYINGTITITVEVDNKEFRVTVSVAMQPVGTWMLTVKNDTLESVSKKYIPFTTDQGGLVTGLGISAFKQSGDGFDFAVWKTVNGTTHTCDAGLSIYITTQTVDNQTVYEGHVEMTGSVHSKNTGTAQSPHYAWVLNEDGSGHVADGAINWSWNNAMQDWQLEVLGTFKGVIKRSKVTIDNSNKHLYCPIDYDELSGIGIRSIKLDEVGSFVAFDEGLTVSPSSVEQQVTVDSKIQIDLPTLPDGTTSGMTDDEWKAWSDYCRSLVGCKIVVINRSQVTLKFFSAYGYYRDVISVENEYRIEMKSNDMELTQGHFAIIECKMDVDAVNGKEIVYWEQRSGVMANKNDQNYGTFQIRR